MATVTATPKQEEQPVAGLMYIEVEMKAPPPPKSQRGRKPKDVIQVFGPVQVAGNISWETFVDLIVKAVKSNSEQIDTNSIQFRTTTTATATSYRPVSNDLGVRAMINVLQEKRKGSILPTFHVKIPQPAQALVSVGLSIRM